MHRYARAAAEQAQPDHLTARHAAQQTREARTQAWHELRDTEQHYSMALQHYGTLGCVDDPAARLTTEEHAITRHTTTLYAAREGYLTDDEATTLEAQVRTARQRRPKR